MSKDTKAAPPNILTKKITKNEIIATALGTIAILVFMLAYQGANTEIKPADQQADLQQNSPSRPVEGGQPEVEFPLNLEFAERLRAVSDVYSLRQILRAQGQVERQDKVNNYRWYSKANSPRAYITVAEYEDGSFAGSMLGVEGNNRFRVTFNNAGAFICDECQKPTWVCGAKASYLSDEAYAGCLSAQRRHE